MLLSLIAENNITASNVPLGGQYRATGSRWGHRCDTLPFSILETIYHFFQVKILGDFCVEAAVT